MPVKSVVSIDVDQTKFDSFRENFNKYNAELAKSPELWAAVGQENKSIAAGFKAMTAAMLAQADAQKKVVEESKKGTANTERASNYWKGMTASTKAVLGNVNKIKDAVESIMKWTGFGFIGGALGSIGSLFAFDRLASYANNARRSSTGLGVSLGQQNAFNVTFGRYVDTGSLLHGVSTALGDITSPEARALFSLGIVPGQSGNTAETSLEVLKRARDLANNNKDDRVLGTRANALGLGSLGIGIEELRRLRGMSDDDLKRYSERARTLGASPDSLKKMQEFDITLGELGVKLKTSLVDGLSNLATPLSKLTEAFGEAVKKILGSQGFKDAIAWLSQKLTEFANWVASPQFKSDLKDFAEGVGYAAKKIISGLRLLGLIPDEKSPQQKKVEQGIDQYKPVTGGLAGWLAKHMVGGGGGTVGSVGGTSGGSVGSVGGPPGSVTVMANGGAGETAALKVIAGLEGGLDKNGNPRTSPAGAIGKYQIMPGTGRDYGFSVADLKDPAKNEQAARAIVHSLMARYHGNLAQVLAAYNGGPGIGDFLRDHGYLPTTYHGKSWDYKQTQGYLERAGIRVEVRAENNTGGNTNLSASAMGIQ